MKKLGIAMVLTLVCAVAGAQSLASVAKKERKRREDNRKEGVKSITLVQNQAVVAEKPQAKADGTASAGKPTPEKQETPEQQSGASPSKNEPPKAADS